jgi:TonB family protein
MSRRWLVAVSALVHLAVAGGLFVSGVWRLERLEAPRLALRGLGYMMPPPAPSGGPVAREPIKIERKIIKKKPQELVQLDARKRHDDPPPVKDDDDGGDDGPGHGPGTSTDTGECLENCGDSKAEAPVCGDRLVAGDEQCDDGNTVNGDGCSSTCRLEPKLAPPARPRILTSAVLDGMRISGETQIHPSAATRNMMMRANVMSTFGVIVLCIATDGSVASAKLSRSTSYSEYDESLLLGVRTWRYRPYMVNGAPVPACGTVRFDYRMN